ncbi:hypothetical protein IW262DRAFT_1281010 [Armillaria fumosa]|nr:hypothetical protein IW262DRAFT_1281010 [Armillaria fumosa]
MAGPIHKIVGDHGGPAYDRVQEAFDIIKHRHKLDLRSYSYLQPEQYDFFHPTMTIMEELISRVHLSDTHGGDCVFRLDQRRFSQFMSALRKQRSQAQESLEVNGIPNLLLPPWGSMNDVTAWLTLNELEVFSIRFRAETEHFLSTLLVFHDWDRGEPREFHEERDVTPACQVGQVPKREESRQPTEIPKHANGRRCQPSFTDIQTHSRSVRPSGAPAPAAVTNTHGWTSYQFKDPRGYKAEPDPDLGDNDDEDDWGGKRPKRKPLGPNLPDNSKQGVTPVKTTGPQFDQKLKFSDLPTWNGNTSTLISWLRKIDEFSYWSNAINTQLGKIIPTRLTDSAEKWYYSLPTEHRKDIKSDWDSLRAAIAAYYMNWKFWEELKSKAMHATYRDWGHTRETPSEYYIQKKELLKLTGKWDDTSLISEIMEGAPEIWTTILITELYSMAIEFQNAIRFHEHTLMKLSNSSQPPRSAEWTARTNLVGASPNLPPPRFPKNDSNVSKWKFTPRQKGARPCRHCGSDQHWDPECEHHYEETRRARTNHINTEVDEAQAEYEDLYYELDNISREEPQVTESSCHVVMSDKSVMAQQVPYQDSQALSDIGDMPKGDYLPQPAVSRHACTAFYEKPALNRRT